MGKGDNRTRKGKIKNGSYGKTRSQRTGDAKHTATVAPVAEATVETPKKTAKKTTKAKTDEKPAE